MIPVNERYFETRLSTVPGLRPSHSSDPLMLRIVWPKPRELTIALCGVMVPGPFCVIQYQIAVFHEVVAFVATWSGLFSRLMPR